MFSKELSYWNKKLYITNFHKSKHAVTPGNVNSLALPDLNALIDAT